MKFFNLFYNIPNHPIVIVDQAEGGNVNLVVHEIFQIVDFQIKRCEVIIIAILVHLYLQYCGKEGGNGRRPDVDDHGVDVSVTQIDQCRTELGGTGLAKDELYVLRQWQLH